MSIEIPPAPARQPVRWRRALDEAARADPPSPTTPTTPSHLAYALGRREFERNFQRFAASASGAALLAERPSLLAALSDREALARLPDGSFGRAYLAYLEPTASRPTG